jgi:hypothetical protein
VSLAGLGGMGADPPCQVAVSFRFCLCMRVRGGGRVPMYFCLRRGRALGPWSNRRSCSPEEGLPAILSVVELAHKIQVQSKAGGCLLACCVPDPFSSVPCPRPRGCSVSRQAAIAGPFGGSCKWALLNAALIGMLPRVPSSRHRAAAVSSNLRQRSHRLSVAWL